MNSRSVTSYLELQFRAVETLAPEVYRRMSGSSVHDLRVATRRARAAIWILRQSSSQPRLKKLARELRKWGRALGRVRELDIAIRDSRHYAIDVSLLKVEREEARKALRKVIGRKRRARFAKDAGEAEVRLNEPVSLAEATDQLRARLSRRLLHPGHGPAELHRLRIILKKTRYALEALGSSPDILKNVLDPLGEAHDLAHLQELTGKREKIKRDQRALNHQARRLVKPVLRFALARLNEA